MSDLLLAQAERRFAAENTIENEAALLRARVRAGHKIDLGLLQFLGVRSAALVTDERRVFLCQHGDVTRDGGEWVCVHQPYAGSSPAEARCVFGAISNPTDQLRAYLYMAEPARERMFEVWPFKIGYHGLCVRSSEAIDAAKRILEAYELGRGIGDGESTRLSMAGSTINAWTLGVFYFFTMPHVGDKIPGGALYHVASELNRASSAPLRELIGWVAEGFRRHALGIA